jgi:aerobic-type carbon monoxide dehydrogenase small subunit (CoxS/CutS family)
VIVNGRPAAATPEPNELLLDYLRERLGLTGAKRSCEVQVCGACTVLVDGAPVSACCTLAADAQGRDVLTVEGFAELPEFERYEDVFTRHASVQCGFCTSGMLLTVKSLLDAGESLASDDEVKGALAGNLCRCTGYKGIVEAVRELASAAPAAASSLLETD